MKKKKKACKCPIDRQRSKIMFKPRCRQALSDPLSVSGNVIENLCFFVWGGKKKDCFVDLKICLRIKRDEIFK